VKQVYPRCYGRIFDITHNLGVRKTAWKSESSIVMNKYYKHPKISCNINLMLNKTKPKDNMRYIA